MKTIVRTITSMLSKLHLFVRGLFAADDTAPQRLGFPLQSTADISDETQAILPRVALRDYVNFYNREYRKYGFVRDVKKTVRLMKREEFAHQRALILTLRKLADRQETPENKKILPLLQEKNMEAIERELRKAKEELDATEVKSQQR